VVVGVPPVVGVPVVVPLGLPVVVPLGFPPDVVPLGLPLVVVPDPWPLPPPPEVSPPVLLVPLEVSLHPVNETNRYAANAVPATKSTRVELAEDLG
jgi:hypothetical protein